MSFGRQRESGVELAERRGKRGSPVVPSSLASARVTELLQAWNEGDQAALPQLVPFVYSELRRLARGYMHRERADHTLQATALVNEVYLRLVDVTRMRWQNRTHFFAVCARLMRRILVDHARSRRYLKRGGGARRTSLDEALVVTSEPNPDLIALDEALDDLGTIDSRKSRVVELRFFGGLTVEETAAVLEVSPDTVMRDWKLAKVWLLREIEGDTRRAHA
jgi:RNA polymerase sigma factor (TIGR02999 family)